MGAVAVLSCHPHSTAGLSRWTGGHAQVQCSGLAAALPCCVAMHHCTPGCVMREAGSSVLLLAEYQGLLLCSHAPAWHDCCHGGGMLQMSPHELQAVSGSANAALQH
jgi:hypothetical protein